MSVLTTFIHVSFIIVTILIFSFIYLVEKKSYFLYWALSWVFWFVKFITDIFIIIYGYDTVFLNIIMLLSWLFASIFLIYGVYSFLNQSVPSIFKILLAFLFAWAILLPLFSLSADTINIPFFIFIGFMLFVTGIELLRYNKVKVTGKYISGWAIILAGIHVADFPFLADIEWFAPYGYLIAVVLYITMAIGILLLYYQKLKTELSESEERFRLLAENASDIIFRFRIKTQKLDYISPSAEEIIGYSIEDFYNDFSLYHRIIYPEDLKSVGIFNKNPGNSKEIFSYRIKRKDNKIIWIEQRNSFIFNQNGDLDAIEGIMRDVTKRKKVEEELRLLEKSRTHFITNISHDLRSPITSIQGYTEALMKGIIKENDQNKYLNIIHNKAKELTSLIDDLFELSQLESRRITLNLVEISPHHFISQLRQKYEFEIERKGLHFIIENQIKSESLKIYMDVDKINRVFNNLIYNAVKHTLAGGSITLSFQMDKLDHKLLVEVKDTGSGIDETDLPHIFERFYKGTLKPHSSSKGSGLGLAIAKEIIELHGGEIWVRSKTYEGSSFYFTLSLHIQDDKMML